MIFTQCSVYRVLLVPIRQKTSHQHVTSNDPHPIIVSISTSLIHISTSLIHIKTSLIHIKTNSIFVMVSIVLPAGKPHTVR